MSRERASVFDDDTDELDVSDFTPTKILPPRPPAEQVRAISEANKFPSREAKSAPAPSAPAAPALAVEKREPRRYRTGRTTLVSLKTTPEASQAFYAIADAQGWKVGETFERALAALECELKTKV